MINPIFTTTIPTAAIETPEAIFYSHYQPKPQEPHTAVTQLIQGIYQAYPERALKLLRLPILLNHSPSVLCRGMIAMAGKRFRIDLNYFQKSHSHIFIPVAYNPSLTLSKEPLSPPLIYTDIQEWIQQPPQQQPLQTKVRSVLINYDKSYLMSAESDAITNKTLHSEVVLLQKYYALHQQGFSMPTTLMTNLQSCKMCAAMWWHMHCNPWKNLESVYSYPELGPSARDTVLTSGGNWRRSLAKSDEEIHQVLEHSFF